MTTIFGIRHHGPGSTKSLLRALQNLEPDCLLIEGVKDAEALLQHVAKLHKVSRGDPPCIKGGGPHAPPPVLSAKQTNKKVLLAVFGQNCSEKRRLRPHTDLVKSIKIICWLFFDEIALKKGACGHTQTW